MSYDNSICAQIANLNNKERYKFVDTMEKNIICRDKPYDESYFIYLKTYINEIKINSHSFDDYKQACYYLEKLQWIESKNIELTYYKIEEEISESLKTALPENMKVNLLNLLDLQAEREKKLLYVKRQ